MGHIYYVCRQCGSADIEYLVWFSQCSHTTLEDVVEDQCYWCTDCRDVVEVFTEEVDDPADLPERIAAARKVDQ